MLSLNCDGRLVCKRTLSHLGKRRNNPDVRVIRIHCGVSKTSKRRSLPSGGGVALLPLWEDDKHDLVTDEGFVSRCTSLSALLIADYLSPTCLPLLASASLLPLPVSLQCVNSASLCPCHITPSSGCGCWSMPTRQREMMPAPRAGIGLITQMDSHLILTPKSHLNQSTFCSLELDFSCRGRRRKSRKAHLILISASLSQTHVR